MPQRSSLLPYRGVLSFLSKAREASGGEAARVHHAAQQRGSVAAYGARRSRRCRSLGGYPLYLLVRIASSLRADMIFGKDRGVSG
jgi:hypothetical protein